MNIALLKMIIRLLLITVFASCRLSFFAEHKRPNFYDYKKFPYRKIEADNKAPFMFASTNKPKTPKSMVSGESFESYLRRSGTVAFLVVKNDTIQYEKYFKGFDRTSIVNSFSVAKSITSLLIGCAVDDGLIHSIYDPITAYLPELKGKGFEKILIKHLLQMTSAIDFTENYEQRNKDALQLYYGRDTRKFLTQLKIKTNPGLQFAYISINSQLLGLILERALKTKTVAQYLQERIWQPMGMEYDASWSTDKKEGGLEKTYCCLNARAIDFAKIGRLYLNKGNWNGVRIVSKTWVEASTKIDTSGGSAWNYQYNWWLPTRSGDFMAEGHLGQFVYVNPMKNLVIVRFGEKEGEVNWWLQFLAIAAAY